MCTSLCVSAWYFKAPTETFAEYQIIHRLIIYLPLVLFSAAYRAFVYRALLQHWLFPDMENILLSKVQQVT